MDNKKVLYTTVEYFGGLDPFRLVQANESNDIASGGFPENVVANEWLTVVSGAEPVINAAIGYSWVVGEKMMLMAGFRTDFNYVKDYNYDPQFDPITLKGLYADNYHITGGLAWTIL